MGELASGLEIHAVCQVLEVAFLVPLGATPLQEAMGQGLAGGALSAGPSLGMSTDSSPAMRR